MKNLLYAVFYLIGAVPFGYITAKLKNVDITKQGSGNIGATNVYREIGKKWGIIVFILDALKGYAVCFSADYFGLNLAVAGIAAVLGHLYPVYLKFKGGKGVAAGFGIFLYIMPLSVLAAFAVFILLLISFKYVSLGSVTAAALLPCFSYIFGYEDWKIITAALVSIFVIYKHIPNIRRLAAGTENKIK